MFKYKFDKLFFNGLWITSYLEGREMETIKVSERQRRIYWKKYNESEVEVVNNLTYRG